MNCGARGLATKCKYKCMLRPIGVFNFYTQRDVVWYLPGRDGYMHESKCPVLNWNYSDLPKTNTEIQNEDKLRAEYLEKRYQEGLLRCWQLVNEEYFRRVDSHLERLQSIGEFWQRRRD